MSEKCFCVVFPSLKIGFAFCSFKLSIFPSIFRKLVEDIQGIDGEDMIGLTMLNSSDETVIETHLYNLNIKVDLYPFSK